MDTKPKMKVNAKLTKNLIKKQKDIQKQMMDKKFKGGGVGPKGAAFAGTNSCIGCKGGG